jgi:predicted small metal-binding protein
MKTITCKQFGGPCDFAMTAATEEEMKAMAWKHVAEAHPERMEQTKGAMQNAKPEGAAKAAAYFHSVWESVPEDGK